MFAGRLVARWKWRGGVIDTSITLTFVPHLIKGKTRISRNNAVFWDMTPSGLLEF
jgi:hypothetical protein